MSDFKESLYKKKSFIYQIGEEYYAIGANTFAKVTDSPEVDNIELLQNALQKGNDRQIEKYLEKITRNANFYRVDAREHYRLRDKLLSFSISLKPVTKRLSSHFRIRCFDSMSCAKNISIRYEECDIFQSILFLL